MAAIDRERSKSPRRPNPHSIQDEDGQPIAIVDELSTVGFPDDMDAAFLFEETGADLKLCISNSDCYYLYALDLLENLV